MPQKAQVFDLGIPVQHAAQVPMQRFFEPSGGRLRQELSNAIEASPITKTERPQDIPAAAEVQYGSHTDGVADPDRGLFFGRHRLTNGPPGVRLHDQPGEALSVADIVLDYGREICLIPWHNDVRVTLAESRRSRDV